MPVKIQLRRGTASQWSSANSILANGELAVETDTNKIKIGDGITPWNSLTYGGTQGTTGTTGISSASTGALSYMPTSSAPSGWLSANGLEIASSSYPDLTAFLPASITSITTPTSISTSGYYPATWLPTTGIFDYTTVGNYYNDGAYLSNYVSSGQFIDAFSITFSQPVILSAITMLSVGFGAPPSAWEIRSIGGTVVAGAAGTWAQIGGYNSGVTPNWYSFSTSVVADTYIVQVKHDVGYSTDIGIARMGFKISLNATSGFKFLPILSSITVSPLNQILYPYIKT